MDYEISIVFRNLYIYIVCCGADGGEMEVIREQ